MRCKICGYDEDEHVCEGERPHLYRTAGGGWFAVCGRCSRRGLEIATPKAEIAWAELTRRGWIWLSNDAGGYAKCPECSRPDVAAGTAMSLFAVTYGRRNQ